MGFRCGIVGLPNVGKSTLFNALTRASVRAENYPFCTIEPNVGHVAVPDPRLDQLCALVQPERCVPNTLCFVDIAGLVSGAAQGEGLGNQFLSHIRETQAIAHVVRCYEDEDVVHVHGQIDPVSDIETIETELILADLAVAEKALSKLEKQTKSGDKKAREHKAVLDQIVGHLSQGGSVRQLSFPEASQPWVQAYQFLTDKPLFYVANISDQGTQGNALLQAVQDLAKAQSIPVLPICAAMEAEIWRLPEEDRALFLAELGMGEPGLNPFIRLGYALLGLQTFFTAGPKEVRAWSLKAGMTAAQAAGVIHSDFERHFIRAEVTALADYLRCGGEQGAKDAGLLRLEGKDYQVHDADVVYFRTSPSGRQTKG